jgi:hypothetical protein
MLDPRAEEGPKPVASWVRALAWTIVTSSCLALAGALLQLSQRGLENVDWLRIAPFVLLAAWVLPPILIVALTGRPPRSWLGLGTLLWQSPRERPPTSPRG